MNAVDQRRIELLRLLRPGQKAAVLTQQSPELFLTASALFEQDYRHELGHKVIAQVGHAGLLVLAVLTDIVPGIRAELTIWSRSSRGLAGREFLRAVFGVVFKEWRCLRLSAVIATRNRPSHRGAVALGFVPEARLERWFGDDDGVIYRMYRERCRWIKEESHEGIRACA